MGLETPSSSGSPRWGSNTKLIIGLTMVALIAALVINFRDIIGPIILAFILAFVLQPIAAQLSTYGRLPWRTSVNLVYLFLLIVLIGVIGVAGYALIQQSTALISSVELFITQLPATVEQLSHLQFAFGPFQWDLSRLDLTSFINQLLGVVQTMVGQAGTLVGRFAAVTASTLGWVLFILLISYFLLAESGQLREDLLHIQIPGYDVDSRRLVREITMIWDSFLRGQLVISFLIVLSYYIMLTILGARLSLAIAILAGFAAFVPYVGPVIVWTTTGVITYLQPSNYFGLAPMTYVLVVLAACLVLNQVFDSYITPRLMGRALGVHPAGVLIAALIAANLIGFVGLVLAAPVLATTTLLMRYVTRKMLDLDPWPVVEYRPREIVPIWVRASRRAQILWRWLRSKFPA